MLVIIGYNTDRNEKKDRTVDQASSQKRLDISMTIQSLSVSAFHLYLCAETLSGRDTKGLELQTSLGTASWLKKQRRKVCFLLANCAQLSFQETFEILVSNCSYEHPGSCSFCYCILTLCIHGAASYFLLIHEQWFPLT